MSWRASLRPTGAGLGSLAAVLVLLATAINYASNLVFGMAFILLALWLQAAWDAWRNLAGLTLRWGPAPHAFAGEEADFRIVLVGPPTRPRHRVALAIAGREGPPEGLLQSGDGASIARPVLARGLPVFSDFRLISTWPLGLWRASRLLPPCSAVVYPRPDGALPLPEGHPDPAHNSNEASDFQGLRPYAPGDSPRHINWRAFARRGEPAVNRFDGSRGGYALWLRDGACTGDLEARLSQLALWVVEADRQGREFGLGLQAVRIPPARGHVQRQLCLSALAAVELRGARGVSAS